MFIELARGNLANRAEILDLLHNLPAVISASDAEALVLIEQRFLMGRGMGYIDIHLLASTLLEEDARPWTKDTRFASVAKDLSLLHRIRH